MSFGDYAETPAGHSLPVTFEDAIARFAKHCGLGKRQAANVVEQLLDATQRYSKRVAALTGVHYDNKERLIKRVKEVREKRQ
jgi:hypothetical protein